MTFARGVFSFVLPLIPVAVLLVMHERMLQAIVVSGVASIVLDIFIPESPSFATARLVCIVLFVVFLAQALFTNHSVYVALALTFLARILDRIWLAGLSWWRGWMSIGDVVNTTWMDARWIFVSDACLVGIVFALTTFLLKRFMIGRLPDAQRYV